jgi:hypothetical protein
VFLISSVALAVLSYLRIDTLGFVARTTESGRQRGGSLSSVYGRIWLYCWSGQYPAESPKHAGSFEHTSKPLDWKERQNMRTWFDMVNTERDWEFAGVRIERMERDASVTGVPVSVVEWTLHLPYWVIIAISSLLPLLWLARRLRNRHAPGCCRKCGYDLRATPERCPECGTPVEPGRVTGFQPVRGATESHGPVGSSAQRTG